MREVINVEPKEDYILLLTFENGEKRIKDMKPYLEKGVFQKLKEKKFFNQVKISFGTICWNNEIDLCPDNLYETSTPIHE